MAPLLIFEGAELVGKSFIISQVYDHLERQYSTSDRMLDGCHWFNCDVGIFGGQHGRLVIEKYTDIAEAITDRPVIFEKFHISDTAYHLIHKNEKIRYTDIESRLAQRGGRIVFCTVADDERLFEKRLADRLKLYPHYGRIARIPADYVAQQRVYRDLIARSTLPTLTVDTTMLPNAGVVSDIMHWIGP